MARQGCAVRQAETQHLSPRSSPGDGSTTPSQGPARMTPGARVLPTRSKPNRRLAAERGRTGVVGNTGSSGRLYSAENRLNDSAQRSSAPPRAPAAHDIEIFEIEKDENHTL